MTGLFHPPVTFTVAFWVAFWLRAVRPSRPSLIRWASESEETRTSMSAVADPALTLVRAFSRR